MGRIIQPEPGIHLPAVITPPRRPLEIGSYKFEITTG